MNAEAKTTTRTVTLTVRSSLSEDDLTRDIERAVGDLANVELDYVQESTGRLVADRLLVTELVDDENSGARQMVDVSHVGHALSIGTVGAFPEEEYPDVAHEPRVAIDVFDGELRLLVYAPQVDGGACEEPAIYMLRSLTPAEGSAGEGAG